MRGDPRPATLDHYDWSELRHSLRRRLQALAYRRDEDLLDDLAQEAVVRLLRALRREEPRDLERLMTTIASRTFADHLRRRKELPLEPDDPRIAELRAPSVREGWRHPLDLLDLAVRELFRRQDPTCLYLYRQWRVRREWREVAAAMDPPSTAEAVRQKYSRCLKRILPQLRLDARYTRIAEYAETGED